MSGNLIVIGSSGASAVSGDDLRASQVNGLSFVITCTTPNCPVVSTIGGSIDLSKLRYVPRGSSALEATASLSVFRYENQAQADAFLAAMGSAWLTDKTVFSLDD